MNYFFTKKKLAVSLFHASLTSEKAVKKQSNSQMKAFFSFCVISIYLLNDCVQSLFHQSVGWKIMCKSVSRSSIQMKFGAHNQNFKFLPMIRFVKLINHYLILIKNISLL